METGKVVEIIGAVIDVQFPRESIPNIYDWFIACGERKVYESVLLMVISILELCIV